MQASLSEGAGEGADEYSSRREGSCVYSAHVVPQTERAPSYLKRMSQITEAVGPGEWRQQDGGKMKRKRVGRDGEMCNFSLPVM